MKMIHTGVGAFFLWLTLGACALYPDADYEDSASQLAANLVLQLEQRVDLRNLKVLVVEFQPCERTDDGSFVPVMNASMANQHQMTSIRLRHAIMGSLASRISVLEPLVGTAVRAREAGRYGPLDRFEAAKEVGATAILTGNFGMQDAEGKEGVLLFLRLVSVEDRVILAATEGLIPHPNTHPMESSNHDED